MLSEQELQQICRAYEIVCPVCGTSNSYHRLKRDMARPATTEGDGHPTKWKWAKPGFDSVDPKWFFMGSCGKCGFTGELDDADYRTCGKNPDGYKKDFSEEGLQQLLSASSVGKGIAQSLLKRISDDDPFGSTLAKLHLGILCQCLRQRVMPGTIARYYLRIAWLFRDHETYYAEADPGALAEKIGKLRKRWKRELPEHDDYPAQPDLALEEAEALTLCRSFFERNYETLKQAGQEDELRLRLLLAEIGFRLYELTNSESDYKRAASFFSGTMQQCLSIVSDKTIVGGIVNRAREMLETSGERGRELRALHKSRGGTDDNGDSETPKAAKKKKKVRKGDAPMKDSASAKDATAARGKGKKEKSAPVGPNGKGNGAEAIATPKPADEDIEEGTQAERDKATRQMSLLKEEVRDAEGAGEGPRGRQQEVAPAHRSRRPDRFTQ